MYIEILNQKILVNIILYLNNLLQKIHKKLLINNNILKKKKKIVIGDGIDYNKLYLLDFGLSK